MFGSINPRLSLRKKITITIPSNTQNYVLNTAKVAGLLYKPGQTDITLVISPGVYVGSASTGSYALQVDTSWNPRDTITIINNGFITGMGGAGGYGGDGGYSVGPGISGYSGGPALQAQRATSVTNNGVIGGGGGGGGGGDGYSTYGGCCSSSYFPGSGGGGGEGYSGGTGGAGGIGNVGSNGYPGGSGTNSTAGGGGAGRSGAGSGGSGGSFGSSGGTSGTNTYVSTTHPGGASGAAVVGNSYINWKSIGTILGGIS